MRIVVRTKPKKRYHEINTDDLPEFKTNLLVGCLVFPIAVAAVFGGILTFIKWSS